MLSTCVCSLSGWRVGWAVGSACIVSAIRNIHIKLTDSAPAPFQEAALTALRSPLEYFELLRMVGIKNYLFPGFVNLIVCNGADIGEMCNHIYANYVLMHFYIGA